MRSHIICTDLGISSNCSNLYAVFRLVPTGRSSKGVRVGFCESGDVLSSGYRSQCGCWLPAGAGNVLWI